MELFKFADSSAFLSHDLVTLSDPPPPWAITFSRLALEQIVSPIQIWQKAGKLLWSKIFMNN